MKIYVLYGNDGLVGWNLSVGIYRCRAARGGLNFKIFSVCFDTLRGGGNFIADRLCGAAMVAVRLCFIRSFGS